MPRFSVRNVEIDTEAHEIRSGGERQSLEPRAFDALRYLIANRGRTVSKQELLDEVWLGRVVTDSVLTQAIAKCRRVLQDESADLIKTVHRVGYRFDGPVVEAAEHSSGEGQTLVVELAVSVRDGERLPMPAGARRHADGLSLRFESVGQAVEQALNLQGAGCEDGLGIHAGPVSADLDELPDPAQIATQLCRAASPGQILLSATGFELGRVDATLRAISGLTWLAHGAYQFADLNTVVNLFEVGVPGKAPMQPPSDRHNIRRALADDVILGWRAAPGQRVPNRTHWELKRCLGEGGFGEAWLAEHDKTREQRVFKFCYRADRLRSLQREVTLFRLLLETLGDRPDIARILDWNFTEAPYFVESEYSADGDLNQWMARQGGASKVDLVTRLELVSKTARALAAAHAVGVLHKDVKPANILIREPEEGPPRAILCDFGIGLITDRTALDEHDITRLGATDTLVSNVTTARSGTRRYMAPEILEGKSPTIQADIYALGVVLYQLVVGDLERVLAPGWEREIEDDVLRDDIAKMVDRDPSRRPGDANRVAERLDTLEARRETRRARRAAQAKLDRERRRRRILIPAVAGTTLFAIAMAFLSYRVSEEADRANEQARLAEAASNYLTGIFDSANPYNLRGKDLSAKDLLDVGARELDTDPGLEPELRARLYLAIGRAYIGLLDFDSARSKLGRVDTLIAENGLSGFELSRLLAWAALHRRQGKLDDARDLLDRARELAEPEPKSLALVLEERAAIENLALDHQAALPLLQQAASIRAELVPADGFQLLETRSELAETLNALGDHQRAELIFQEIIPEYGDSQPAVIETLQRYARLLLRTDRLYEAWQNAHRAYTTAQSVLPADHPALADAADTLASTLIPRGNFEEAEALHQAAYRIRQQALGDHPKTAQSVTRLANLYMNTDDYTLARQYFKETFRLNEALYGDENYMTAASLVDYALLLFDFPEAHQEAVETLEKATAIFDNTLGNQHWATGMAYLYLSRARYQVGDLNRAEAEGDRAVAIMDRAYPDGGYRHSLAYLQRGSVWFAQGRVQESLATFDQHFPILAEHRDSDAEDYQVALEIYGAIRQAAGQSP